MDQTFLMLIFGALALGGVIALSSGGGDDDDVPAVEDDTPGDTGGDTPADTPGDTGGDTPGDTGGDTPGDTGGEDGGTDDNPYGYTYAPPTPDLERYATLPVIESTDPYIPGTEDAEAILGNGTLQEINGFGGDDAIDGAGGYNFMFGGAGEDLIQTSTSAREIAFGWGGDDADILLGGDGEDYLVAGGSNDVDTFFASGPSGQLAFDEPDTAPGDLLDGGAGQDGLAFGAGDYAFGGDDQDSFTLIDTNLVATADDPAFIADYEPGELIELMDAGDGTVTFDTYEDDALILIDEQLVVVVRGAAATLDPADVVAIAGRNAWPGEAALPVEPTPTSLSL